MMIKFEQVSKRYPGGYEALSHVNFSLQKGEMALMAEKFGKELETKLEIPVLFVDERLSSRHADQGLRELSLSRKERTAKLDQTSAAFLLQSYLEKLKLL